MSEATRIGGLIVARHLSKSFSVTLAVLAAVASLASSARADEGGVSFWLPGQYGSFAAVAPDPGFSLPIVSYFYSGSVDPSKRLNRGKSADYGLSGQFFGEFMVPTYTPDTTFLGARPSFSLTMLPAWSGASVNLSFPSFLNAPPISATQSDSITGFGDLYPTAQLYWNSGVNNWMTYVTGDIPLGAYSSSRLANLGIGHAAIDFGGAYTYLNPKTGFEFSATSGLTFNLENPSTNYTNGIDWHLDVGMAQFLSEKLFVGAVGYAYQQLTPDQGQRAIALGAAESRTFGIGPQIGYNFNAYGMPIYTNLKAYFEFGSSYRLQGGGAFLTINLPLSQLAKAKNSPVN